MASAEVWATRVAEWRRSGLTAAAFASSRGLSAGTLKWWSSKLRRREAKLVRVVVAEAPASPRDDAIEVELKGARVRVRPGVDRTTLVTVLAALDARGGS